MDTWQPKSVNIRLKAGRRKPENRAQGSIRPWCLAAKETNPVLKTSRSRSFQDGFEFAFEWGARSNPFVGLRFESLFHVIFALDFPQKEPFQPWFDLTSRLRPSRPFLSLHGGFPFIEPLPLLSDKPPRPYHSQQTLVMRFSLCATSLSVNYFRAPFGNLIMSLLSRSITA